MLPRVHIDEIGLPVVAMFCYPAAHFNEVANTSLALRLLDGNVVFYGLVDGLRWQRATSAPTGGLVERGSLASECFSHSRLLRSQGIRFAISDPRN